jgi:hypothetical protein
MDISVGEAFSDVGANKLYRKALQAVGMCRR